MSSSRDPPASAWLRCQRGRRRRPGAATRPYRSCRCLRATLPARLIVPSSRHTSVKRDHITLDDDGRMNSASETVVRPLPRRPANISLSPRLSDRVGADFREARSAALAEVTNTPTPNRFFAMETTLGTSAWSTTKGVVPRSRRGLRQTIAVGCAGPSRTEPSRLTGRLRCFE